jgi:hypothetical protein
MIVSDEASAVGKISIDLPDSPGCKRQATNRLAGLRGAGAAIIAGTCAMPTSKLPVWAWVQISFIVTMFVLSLWFSWYLWHAGARIVAATPPMLFGAVMTLYSLWMRSRRHP